VITIEDEGSGIPRSEREKVFEPFYRIGSARDPTTGGVGLGLSITRSIVWEHGGDITLGNRKGGGLSVRVALPAGPDDRREAMSLARMFLSAREKAQQCAVDCAPYVHAKLQAVHHEHSPTGRYIIADRPMTEEEWIRERATVIDITPEK
jgi:hypothetical protein